MRVCLERCELCLAESLRLLLPRLKLSIEIPHELIGRSVAHLPQRGDNTGRARVDEGAGEARQLISPRELAQTRLAGRQDDQVRIELPAEDLLDLQSAIIALAGGQAEHRGQGVLLIQVGVHGQVDQRSILQVASSLCLRRFFADEHGCRGE